MAQSNRRKRTAVADKNELSEWLFEEIVAFFELSEERKCEISSFLERMVRKNFSEEKMAEQTHNFYSEILQDFTQNKRKIAPKIAICGYYGHVNFGDEAILNVIKGHLYAQFSTRNEIDKVGDISHRISILNPKNPIKTIKILKNSDVFLFGGGSLLQNKTSNLSLACYLGLIFLASILCKRLVMLCNGIGPLNSNTFGDKILIFFLPKVVNFFDFLSVRDSFSRKMLQKMLPKRKIHLIGDPALAFRDEISQIEVQNGAEKDKKSTFGWTTTPQEQEIAVTDAGGKYFLFCPFGRALEKNGISPDFLGKSMQNLENRLGVRCAFLVLNPSQDLEFTEKAACGREIFVIEDEKTLKKVILGAEFVISQRYHGALFAAMWGRATLCVSDDVKMLGLCKDFGLFEARSAEILGDLPHLVGNIDGAMAHFVENRHTIEPKFSAASHETRAALSSLFEGNFFK